VDGRTGRLVATGPAATGGQLERLALSPDARTLATIDYSGHVQLLDTATGKLRSTLTSSTGNAADIGFAGDPELAFSPDGAYLAVWSNPIGLELWDLRSAASIAVLDGRAAVAPFTTSLGNFYGYDLGPYTQLVVSFGAARETVTVTGERRLGAPPNYLTGFPGDGPSAVRTVTWSLKPSDWERAGCTIVGRDLTTDEWNQYVGASVPYHHTCTPVLATHP
jgi:WD40 repeat protein